MYNLSTIYHILKIRTPRIDVAGEYVGHVPVAPTDTVLMIITCELYEVIDNPLEIVCVDFCKYPSINSEIKVWGSIRHTK